MHVNSKQNNNRSNNNKYSNSNYSQDEGLLELTAATLLQPVYLDIYSVLCCAVLLRPIALRPSGSVLLPEKLQRTRSFVYSVGERKHFRAMCAMPVAAKMLLSCCVLLSLLLLCYISFGNLIITVKMSTKRSSINNNKMTAANRLLTAVAVFNNICTYLVHKQVCRLVGCLVVGLANMCSASGHYF